MNAPAKPSVAVLGGGISGLACAYRLETLGTHVALFEAADMPGGLIGTVEKDGFLFESGPQSFQGVPALLDLIRELGIEGELCRADPRAPRFILRRGRLREIPMSPQGILTTPLLSARSRWKIASEPLRRGRPPVAEESVADFVRRKFGHEILEYLVAPFVSGVYAGDPEKLSLRAAFPTLDEWERNYGSVLRGAIKSGIKEKGGPPPLCSFRRGVNTLPRVLAEKLGDHLHTGARVASVGRATSSAGGFDICVSREGQNQTTTFQAVVVALPAYVAAHLLGAISPPLAHALSGIAYAPVGVVGSGYYARQIGLPVDGFGFLIPRAEKHLTLGTVWNSSLFPGRAREGSVAITSFAGGAANPEVLEMPEGEMAAAVQNENARIMQITGPPAVTAVWKHAKALPQYNLGHGHIVEAIRESSRDIPGLFFSGNYLEGPALGKCVERAFATADSVRAFLQS